MPEARVHAVFEGGISSSRWMARTREDGTFWLPAADSPEDRVHLSASRSGYERVVTESEFGWDARDVRLVIRRGIDLEIVVRRAEDLQPVQRYGLVLRPTGRSGLRAYEPEAPRDGGRTVLENRARASYWLLVLPPAGGDLVQSAPMEVVVADDRPRSHEVLLTRGVRQQVVVLRADGSRATGSRVELLDPLGGEAIHSETLAAPLEEWGTVWGRCPWRSWSPAEPPCASSCARSSSWEICGSRPG